MKQVLQKALLQDVVVKHEKVARDAVLRFSLHKFLGNRSVWNTASNSFAQIAGNGDNFFDVDYLNDAARRFAIRSFASKGKFGDFANPVPGGDFRNSVLVMVPSMVYADIWESPAREWLVELRQNGQGERVINSASPAFQYRNIVVADYGMELTLWNAGRVHVQAAVTAPIKWGDGAPDPETNAVDGIWLSGQNSEDTTHYIQCAPSSFTTNSGADTDINYGDFINISAARTGEFGITNGCDVLDGKTITAEVYSADPATGRIVLRQPLTEEFTADLGGGAFAYVTRAQHIYPVYLFGSRGVCTWAGRTPVRFNMPKDEEADYPSIWRVAWDERGEMNAWSPDDYEIVFCEAQFANRGGVAIR